MNKQIFWIASFPKSGNTLIRYLLTSLFFTNDGIIDLSLLQNIPYIEDTSNLEFIKKINAEDYKNLHSPQILSNYWEKMQSKQNLNLKEDFIFMKTHHALVKIFNNDFTNKENTRGVIYVVRDPRDVVLSMSNHYKITFDESIDKLLDENFCLQWQDTDNLYENKKKPLSLVSSWEKHFLSWNKYAFNCPKLLIKFEDLVYDKKNTIKKIIDFFIKNYNFKFSNLSKKIQNMIVYSDFDHLKKTEQKDGFDEAVNNNFFNKGTKGQWLDKLSDEQIYRIEKKYYNLLKQLNYETKLYNNS